MDQPPYFLLEGVLVPRPAAPTPLMAVEVGICDFLPGVLLLLLLLLVIVIFLLVVGVELFVVVAFLTGDTMKIRYTKEIN